MQLGSNFLGQALGTAPLVKPKLAFDTRKRVLPTPWARVAGFGALDSRKPFSISLWFLLNVLQLGQTHGQNRPDPLTCVPVWLVPFLERRL